MNRYPNQWTLTDYEDMGFERDLIMQAWTDCRRNHNLMIDRLFQLASDRYRRNSHPARHLRMFETATLLKRLPRTHHLRLKFEGDNSLKYLELRKLGLFSKKAFRCVKGLSLDYADKRGYRGQALKKKHMEILGNHMSRNLRKLKHLSIRFDFWDISETVSARLLLQSLKQTFVGLTSLKLSLGDVFSVSERKAPSFGRLFARLGSTLKHLDLDFSRTHLFGLGFSEVLGMMIMKHLRKLETLCLNFDARETSGTTARLLIWGACTHLTCLKSLDISALRCCINQEDWNPVSFKHNLRSNLQCLRLNLASCFDLNLQCLSTLQDDIVELCPKLEELYICTLGGTRFSNQFYSSLEKEFLKRLDLKRLRLHYSNDLDNLWENYPNLQAFESAQEKKMEEEVRNMKEKAGGEEEMQLYYKTEMEEERAPKECEVDEQEYLQWRLDESERIELEECDRVEKGVRWEAVEEDKVNEDDDPNLESGGDDDCFYGEEEDFYWEQERIGWQMEVEQAVIDAAEEEIRFSNLTQGGLIPEISLDYGDSYERR